MRKKYLSYGFAILVAFFVSLSMLSCDSKEQLTYYSNRENYISITGTVSHLKHDEKSAAYYLAFEDMSVSLSDNNFKIVGNNQAIVQQNGFWEKVKIGEQVHFVTAPKYWGDGYVMPIVELAVQDEVLLEFDIGYNNLLEWLKLQ